MIKKIEPKTLFYTRVFLHSEMTTSNRQIYHFLDVLGDLGGVLEILIVVCSVVCCSFAEYSFVIFGVNKFFNARTSTPEIFNEEEAKFNHGADCSGEDC